MRMSTQRGAARPDYPQPLSTFTPAKPRSSRRWLSAIAGLAFSWTMHSATATLLPVTPDIAWPTIVSSRAEAPFTSLVYVDRTSAPEWVLFSGSFNVASEVVVSTSTDPATIKGALMVYTRGITGIGVTSGQKYQLIGASPIRSVLQVPGALAFDAQMAVVLPRTVRPIRPLVMRLPVQMVVNFGADGKIVEAAAPPTGLMGWWQADGSAADVLGNSPSEFSPSEPVGFVPGRLGDAFSFNNAGFVEAATAAEFETPAVTVAAWVRSNGSPGNFSYLVSKGAANCDGASYALFTGANGGLQFYVSDGTAFDFSPDAGAGVWDGNWHLVAGTFDGVAVRLYVDGVEMGDGTASSLAINYDLPTSDSLFIGAYQGTCGLRFTGDVDDVQVFGRALTDIELQGLFDAQR